MRRSRHRLAAVLRLLPFAVLLSVAAGCATIESWSNPLIGRWTADAPLFGGFSLGTYEFKPDSVNAFGFDQEVDYAVYGNRVDVRPRGFGPQLQVTMLDRNTARLGSPLTGELVTLHRVR